MKLSVFWFRRDLRLEDNIALRHAIDSGFQVLPIFIFDRNILDELPRDDTRVNFIHANLHNIHHELRRQGSSLKTFIGTPLEVWNEIIRTYNIRQVYSNRDYEPYALERDRNVKRLLEEHGIQWFDFKDQVIFETSEIGKDDGKPYTVFTPYKRKWLKTYSERFGGPFLSSHTGNILAADLPFPSLSEIGFKSSHVKIRDFDLSGLDSYAGLRDFPAEDATTRIGPHLRFGTVSIRWVVSQLKPENGVFLGELIWREFFMQILYHFPHVVDRNFNRKYDGVLWRNDETEFKRWCRGETGYPLVDAGMRQLNETGFMHNRVRMVVASFLCKHLLIDWRWGEAYFAEKLHDYELSSNNGNWQWAAGTGCDAAPYFRVFNPAEQLKRFDRELKYIKKWIPDFNPDRYIKPIVDHKMARQRAIDVYKAALQGF